MRRPIRPVLVGLLVAAGIAGCTPGAPAQDPAGAPAASAGSPAAAPTSEAGGRDLPDRPRFDTPIDEIFLSSLPPERDPADEARWDESVAACMKEQGFDWVDTRPGNAEPPRYTSGEYIAEHGYGLVSQLRVTQALVDDPPADPHADWSEAQRAAYAWALDGGYPPGQDLVVEAWVDGCTGIASREVFGVERDGLTMQTDTSWEAWADFESELHEARDVEGRPETVAARDAWVACMSDAGYPEVAEVTDVWEVSGVVQRRINEVSAELSAGGLSPSQVVASPQLREVAERERAMAEADLLGCRIEYDRAVHALRLTLEEAFVATHAAELEGWTLYMQEQASGS